MPKGKASIQPRILAVAAVAAVLLAGPVAARSRDENWSQCKDANDPDLKINACTELIQSGQETTTNLAIAFNSRGNAYTDKGQYDRAIQEYDQAIKLNSKYATPYYNRGIAHYALGQFEDAAADFEQNLALDSANNASTSWLKLDAAYAYSVIWRHLACGIMDADDGEELKRNAAWVEYDKWPGPIVALYLDQTTIEQVRAAAKQGSTEARANQNCEAAFYLGEYELLRKSSSTAKTLLQEAVNTCPKSFVEYVGAVAELERLGH